MRMRRKHEFFCTDFTALRLERWGKLYNLVCCVCVPGEAMLLSVLTKQLTP